MCIGGDLLPSGRAPQQEILFHCACGRTQVDPIAPAYCRCERIVQDIAAHCEQLLLQDEGGEDREQSFRDLKPNLLPNSTIEIAIDLIGC